MRSFYRLVLSSLFAAGLTHCASRPGASSSPSPAARGLVREGTPAEVDITKARASGREQGFQWLPYEAASFEKATKEKKLVLLDGAAEWCHWCHVMDETTYRDPEIGRVLSEKFVAIRVDIDEHPDMAERYGAWGWPATILMTAQGEEIGKYQGYLKPKEMLEALDAALKGESNIEGTGSEVAGDRPAAVAELPWALSYAVYAFDFFYDEKLGGWGMRQKAPIGDNLELEARRAARGDQIAKKRVLQTVAAQKPLLDPVWGGIYQYSDSGVWTNPHYEKLMTFQAANLAGYAMAYKATKSPEALDAARGIATYLNTMLSGPDGGYFVSQDADVGSHDKKGAFIDGHVYYERSDAERRKLGMPRVDDNVYAYENGLAIAAMVVFHEATGDAEALARARTAADLVLSTHVKEDGKVLHDAKQERRVVHLADAASFGYAVATLARVTGEPKYRDAALKIAKEMDAQLRAPSGALYGVSEDKGAVGVFAERRTPLEANAIAARLHGELAKLTNDAAHEQRAREILAGVSTPRGIEAMGRLIGAYLLAADDLGLLTELLRR